MVKRRSLVDGLKTTPKADPETEQRFVFEAKKQTAAAVEKVHKPKAPSEPQEQAKSAAPSASEVPARQPAEPNRGRTPLTTRLRADIGAALKRASLERQLAGQTPHTVQDILEEALEPWLKDRDYLK
ncbi:MAG TPA: hypothetical protein VD866_13065 [Urbifossiella sp.]|nr:hypothetical protein [Urbifossiella sp.]